LKKYYYWGAGIIRSTRKKKREGRKRGEDYSADPVGKERGRRFTRGQRVDKERRPDHPWNWRETRGTQRSQRPYTIGLEIKKKNFKGLSRSPTEAGVYRGHEEEGRRPGGLRARFSRGLEEFELREEVKKRPNK